MASRIINFPAQQQRRTLTDLFNSKDVLQFCINLQQSLEIKSLLNTFFTHSRQFVSYSSLTYRHRPEQLFHNFGHHGEYQYELELTIDNQLIGDLQFTHNVPFQAYHQQQLQALSALLLYPLSNGLQLRQAKKRAETDPLTDLPNRISLTNHINREMKLSDRYGLPMAVLALDLDAFKKVNDSYGHQAGDQVLLTVADELRESVRESDLLFRLGGEEFIILAGKSTLEGAQELANRICERVANLRVDYQGQLITTSMSIGVTLYKPGESSHRLIERADQALYQAKASGKNQVWVES